MTAREMLHPTLSLGTALTCMLLLVTTSIQAAEPPAEAAAETRTQPTLVPRISPAAAALEGEKLHHPNPASDRAKSTTTEIRTTTSEGYRFSLADPPRSYLYEARQESTWGSAGDSLAFTSIIAWSFTLRASAVSADRVTLNAVILRVWAKVSGPAVDHRAAAGGGGSEGANSANEAERTLDSEIPASADDPLLGHLIALQGATLVLTLDPRTGEIEHVDGGAEIAKRIAADQPDATNPGAPSPVAAQAAQTYSSETLSRLWTTMLALPDLTALPTAAPLAGVIERTWSGDRYQQTLRGGSAEAVLGKDATTLPATVSGISGSGGLTVKSGWPNEAWGDLTGTVTMAALTQPIEQHLRLRWKLTRLETSR